MKSLLLGGGLFLISLFNSKCERKYYFVVKAIQGLENGVEIQRSHPSQTLRFQLCLSEGFGLRNLLQ